ncbi:MAG: ImmA/IrrE family metallo-endopeptidase [Candidatus Omnitrophica bacterium]|nr:ImmA/IrrE family metallo-endopeptidase [Candidatus Omnitrophota bacterium]
MVAQKLKQLRLAQGWSLDELVARIGGAVTKQAISKYELGKAQPSAKILNKLAAAFKVKTMQLLAEPQYKIEFIAYRKRSGLAMKEQVRIENRVREAMEQRLRVQDLVYAGKSKLAVPQFQINRLEDVESVADQMRAKWGLGRDQLSNVTSILEDNFVHVVEIEAHEKFDGIAAIAYEGKEVKGFAVAVRKGIPGDRQRLNLAHELGHLVLRVSNSVDEEKAAFRFGGAFLAPQEWIKREVGPHRTAIDAQELIILKKKLGMSIQAILHRLSDLGIINNSTYSAWFRTISIMGWRKQEPSPLAVEKPEWLKQHVYRAFAEGILSQKESEVLLGEKIDDKTPLSLQRMRSFMKLSIEERRRILADQADKAAVHYASDASRDAWQTGDFLEQ